MGCEGWDRLPLCGTVASVFIGFRFNSFCRISTFFNVEIRGVLDCGRRFLESLCLRHLALHARNRELEAGY